MQRRYSTKAIKRRLIAWYREATTSELSEGLGWYPKVRHIIRDLAAAHNVSHEVAAAIVAILSPMVRWERNIAEAQLILLGTQPAKPGEFRRPGHSAFPRNVAKAKRLLAHYRVGLVLNESDAATYATGRKVSAFFRLLCRSTGDVVVDSIAIMAAMGIKPTPFTTSDDAKAYFDRPRALNAIEQGYREAAYEVGVRPSQMQAIVWTVWRNERDSQ